MNLELLSETPADPTRRATSSGASHARRQTAWAPEPRVSLAPGEILFEAGQPGCVYQLDSGVLRLDREDRDGSRFMQIALPGDLLGLELLATYPHAFTARALVPSVARPRSLPTDAERRMALLEGLTQQQQRLADLVALRSGTAQERLKHLLGLLAPADSHWAGEAALKALPTIKDVAAVIDSTPETVSRIFANLKRSHILATRQRQGASFSRTRLLESEWPAGMTRSSASPRVSTMGAA